jgi:hypothetical protein
VRTGPAVVLAPQEQAAAEVVGRVLGAAVVDPARSGGPGLVHPGGRSVAVEEATTGEPDDLRLDHLRRVAELQWAAPGRWSWRVTIDDVRWLARVREVFPVAARTCEASLVPRPEQLPARMTTTVPDLHWLVHTQPARLVGDPAVLDRPAAVALGPGRGRPAGPGMAAVPAAVRGWLAGAAAVRALGRLSRRRADERQLYLTIGCTAATADAFDALVRASGVPPALSPRPSGLSHLWLAPVLGPAVFLWSRRDGWSRHEPYTRGSPAAGPG